MRRKFKSKMEATNKHIIRALYVVAMAKKQAKEEKELNDLIADAIKRGSFVIEPSYPDPMIEKFIEDQFK